MQDAGRSKAGVWTLLLLVGFVALFAAQIYSFSHTRALESRLAAIESDQAKAREIAANEISKVRDTAVASDTERQKKIDELKQQLESARQQAVGAAGKTTEGVQKRLETLASRMDANETRLKDGFDKSDARVASEVLKLQQATDSTKSGITAVSTDLRGVKTDLANTESVLDRTIADLRRTSGELGTVKGLIASNAKEIEALKQLGDRNYTEFTLFKTGDPVKIAGVGLRLKKADPKSNLYTIELQAEDRKIEKKDQTVNEPLHFFVGREKQPYELVVNQVGKDQIVGYIASPKTPLTRP